MLTELPFVFKNATIVTRNAHINDMQGNSHASLQDDTLVFCSFLGSCKIRT